MASVNQRLEDRLEIRSKDRDIITGLRGCDPKTPFRELATTLLSDREVVTLSKAFWEKLLLVRYLQHLASWAYESPATYSLERLAISYKTKSGEERVWNSIMPLMVLENGIVCAVPIDEERGTIQEFKDRAGTESLYRLYQKIQLPGGFTFFSVSEVDGIVALDMRKDIPFGAASLALVQSDASEDREQMEQTSEVRVYLYARIEEKGLRKYKVEISKVHERTAYFRRREEETQSSGLQITRMIELTIRREVFGRGYHIVQREDGSEGLVPCTSYWNMPSALLRFHTDPEERMVVAQFDEEGYIFHMAQEVHGQTQHAYFNRALEARQKKHGGMVNNPAHEAYLRKRFEQIFPGMLPKPLDFDAMLANMLKAEDPQVRYLVKSERTGT